MKVYKVVVLTTDTEANLTKKINDLAKEGWEVKSHTEGVIGRARRVINVIFEREQDINDLLEEDEPDETILEQDEEEELGNGECVDGAVYDRGSD